jgi:Ca-activated chloride channel family protein
MKKYVVLLVALAAMICGLNAAGVVLNRNMQTMSMLTLEKTNYQVDIQNQVAVVTVTEVFRNPDLLNYNPRLYFPLFEGASPTQLRWYQNNNWHTALIAGTPSNPQGGPSNLPQYFLDYIGGFPVVFDFDMNLAPTDSLVVELSYVQLLPYSFGEVSMALRNNYFPIGNYPIMEQNFEINLISDRAIQSFLTPGYNAQITQGEHQCSATYFVENTTANMDFYLQYSVTSDALALSAMSGMFEPPDELPDGFFTFIAEPDNEEAEYIPKVFTFIIDKSGSMSGNKMSQAKAAASYITNNLNTGDKFNLISFSSLVNSCWPSHQDFTPANQQTALSYIQGLYAGGSTNISGAFDLAVPQFATADTSAASIIIFFTDGQQTAGITNTNELINHVNSLMDMNETDIYLFNFGVGSDVNRPLLTNLALDNNGMATFLGNDELEQAISDFYDLIRYPVMLATTFTVDPPNAISEVYPNPLPNLYRGKQLIISGRYQNPQPINITFSGNIYTGPVQYPYSATLSASPAAGLEFLPKIWAKQKIESLLQQYYALPSYTAEAIALHDLIVQISIAYGVVCEFTSFTGGATENEEELETPPASDVILLGNYPNPFNPSTTIRFEVKSELRGAAFIKIFNSRGQLVKVLGVHVNRSGIYEIVWDGTDQNGRVVSNGVYFYTLSLDKYILTGKMTMLK